jgi:hypothetical protein
MLNFLEVSVAWEHIAAFTTIGITILYFIHKRKHTTRGNFHSDPSIQSVNRLSSHVALAGHVSEVDARKYVAQPKCSPFVQLLNGYWHFQLFNNVDDAFAVVGHWDERKQSKEECPYESIQVPGHWQLQVPGDAPIYTNIKYIIPVDPPNLPKYNPTGYYHYNFPVSKSWATRKNFLFLGGVDSAYYVWCNRVFIGFAKDSRLQSEFDITNTLVYGGEMNEIEVIVIRYSDGHYLEDQDMFNLSGIFRDVMIISLPNDLRIKDFYWNTSIDSNTQIAAVTINLRLKWNMHMIAALLDVKSLENGVEMNRNAGSYLSQLQLDWVVESKIFEEGILVSSIETPTSHTFFFDNPSPSHICSFTSYAPIPNLSSKGDAFLQQVLTVNSPALWSAEKPHIYTLVVSLRSTRDGTIVQAESCRLAFRMVDISNGLLRVNQRPVLIRGVNYHEHDPLGGHTIPHSLVEADIKLMKRYNFNAVRMSHYPQAPWVYELCSLYGLYVVDEANIETHGMKPYVGRLADDSKWEDAFMLRFTRMVERDRVHPCIIIWSLGNESGYGAVHDKMAAWIRVRDPTRKLMYEPASYGPREDSSHRVMATDILCPMYARVEEAIKLANIFPDYPLIQCEYAHMMGNSGGNLNEYWESFHRFPRMQGGFIWDWVDQGISIIDAKGGLKWAYGGDFGEVEHDANFCLNGLNWPDRGLGWVLSRGTTKDRTKWGKQRGHMSIMKPCYGLSTIVTSEADEASMLMTDDSINQFVEVDGAMAKPVLLEAKQCQRFFECRVIGMKMPGNLTCSLIECDELDYGAGHRYICTEYDGGSDEEQTYRRSVSNPSAPSIARSSSLDSNQNNLIDSITNIQSFSVTLRFSIINKYDIVDDIQTELEFFAFLICDGIVVADSAVKTLTSGYVHRDNSNNNPDESGSGRHSIQELECEGRFKLKCYEMNVEMRRMLDFSRYAGLQFEGIREQYANNLPISEYAIFGTAWSQQILLAADGIDQVTNELRNIKRSPVNASSSSMYWTRIVPMPTGGSDKEESQPPGQFLLSEHVNHTPFRRHDGEIWSVVVIGRLVKDTVWAPKHYPLGFVESNCSKLVQQAIGQPLQGASPSKVHSPALSSSLQKHIDNPSTPTSAREYAPSSILTSHESSSSSRRPTLSGKESTSQSESTLSSVSVKWLRDSANESTGNCSIFDANVILETEVPASPMLSSWIANDMIQPMEPGQGSSSRSVQVIISGSTGTIEAIRINGQDVLMNAQSLGSYGDIKPSRLHLHRAVTDNDRFGYLSRWNAVGLNTELRYKPTGELAGSKLAMDATNDDLDVRGVNTFSNVKIERMSRGIDGSEGVKCSWTMEPAYVDK